MIRYACPFCYKSMPASCPDPAVFQCCGEIGRATLFPECQKCHAEIVDGSDKCDVCGFDAMPAAWRINP